jgi:nitrate reductase delta subunit
MTPAEVSTFDRLAALVSYPRNDLGSRVRDCANALHATSPAAAEEIERLAYATSETPLDVLQDVYVAAFDFDPDCSLELGWHLYGESFERGEFLSTIREGLERLGIPETEGLPDHLVNVLTLLAREEPGRAAALAERITPAITHVREALQHRRNFYAHLLAAIDLAVVSLHAGRPEATTS